MERYLKVENLQRTITWSIMDALRDLFDERIIEIMTLFMESPGKKFFLSDVANKTKVNITTTFRILNRLVEKEFIKSSIIGKTRAYELGQNQKTRDLFKLLKKDDDPLQMFLETVSKIQRIKKVVLEHRERNGAKLVIIGGYIPKDRLDKKIDELKNKHRFDITYAELTEEQYKNLKGFKSYGLEEKIIWKREDDSA